MRLAQALKHKRLIVQARRDASDIARTEVLPGLFQSPKVSRLKPLPVLDAVDMRRWYPDLPVPWLRTVFGGNGRVVAPKIRSREGLKPDRGMVKSRPNKNYLPWSLAFHMPANIAVCVRRKQRKQVMHARGIAGGRVSRPRRRTWVSSISCRG